MTLISMKAMRPRCIGWGSSQMVASTISDEATVIAAPSRTGREGDALRLFTGKVSVALIPPHFRMVLPGIYPEFHENNSLAPELQPTWILTSVAGSPCPPPSTTPDQLVPLRLG